MKKIISFFLLAIVLISCSKDNNRESETSEFLGKWKMTEVLFDPGDGSGTYQPVTENKIIEFLSNGSVTSNYSFCNVVTPADGNYSAPYFASENQISLEDCFDSQYTIEYQLQGDNLILYYPCIEACSYKFVRMSL
ncbi:hypothetical protein [Flavobacterium sp. 25HG05S-40]|uniref:hypothetical protein n=1 Tax=Flavobacterium sp. 25HG05S-40 TaxID=3458682 RepID=UPI00404469E8